MQQVSLAEKALPSLLRFIPGTNNEDIVTRISAEPVVRITRKYYLKVLAHSTRDDFVGEGVGSGLWAVSRTCLSENVAHVTLDGIEANHELVGDLLITPAGSNEPQDIDLALKDAGIRPAARNAAYLLGHKVKPCSNIREEVLDRCARLLGIAAAAVEAISRILAGELGPSGIRANCLRPHAIPEAVATSHTRQLFSGVAGLSGLTTEAPIGVSHES